MRFLFKWAIILAVLAGLAGYGTYLVTGQPPWELVDLPAGAGVDIPAELPGIGEIPEPPQLPDSVSEALPEDTETVYRWRDADGVVQYSNRPPPDGVDARIMEVDPDTNLAGGDRLPGAKPEATGPVPSDTAQKKGKD